MTQTSWTETLFDGVYVIAEGLQFTNAVTARECDLMSGLLELKPGQRILDLACGHGRHAVEFAKRDLKPLVGLDYSLEALEYARQDAARQGLIVDFVQGDMRDLHFDTEFDAIYNMFSSMFYWDDTVHLKILKGVLKALKPGGRFLIDVYNRDVKVAEKILAKHRIVGRLQHIRRVLSFIKRRTIHLFTGGGKPFIHKVTQTEFDPERGVFHGVKHIMIEGKPTIKNRIEVRVHTLTELRALMEDAGFEIEKVVSSPDGGALRLSSPRWIVMARRPV